MEDVLIAYPEGLDPYRPTAGPDEALENFRVVCQLHGTVAENLTNWDDAAHEFAYHAYKQHAHEYGLPESQTTRIDIHWDAVSGVIDYSI